MTPAGRSVRAWARLTALGFALLLPPAVRAQAPQDLVDRAEAAFAEGRFADSVALFDQLAVQVPDARPMLWQRGIALYELGRFRECAAQFASYFAVNRADLENASWHLLCTARAESLDQARANALGAGPDPRILRAEVYDTLRGRMTPEALVTLARSTVDVAHFYAYLYGGLLREILGDRTGAIEYLALAASDRYRDYGGFMNLVARVHLKQMSSR